MAFCGKGSRMFCPGSLETDDCGKCKYCHGIHKYGGQHRLKQKLYYKSRNCHNKGKAASTTGSWLSSDSSIVAEASAAAAGENAVNNHATETPNSVTDASLYSGEEFSRVAAVSHQNRFNINATAAVAADQITFSNSSKVIRT